MEEEILYKVEVEGIESIESLTAANKKLREERKKLDLDSAEGQKRIQEINAKLDQNTNKIKENVSALEKQRLNIGNYQSALDKVIPGFAGFTQGIQGATTASKALIATPLGAILAAVAVVLGVVVAALKKSEPVLDFFENIITQITANIDFLLTNLDKLGSILYDLATFNISGAIDKVKGLTQEMIAVAKAAQLYLDILRELEDEQALFTVSSAAQESQIKALIVASKNRNLTFDEQKEKIQEALKLERELTEQRIDLARKEEVATIKQIALSRGLRQSETENFDQFVERLLRGEQLSGEEKQRVADLSAARIKAESESLAFQEKAANMIAAIDEKETAAHEKRVAQLEKEQEEIRKKAEKLNDVSNLEDTLLTRDIERQEIRLQTTSDFNDSISRVNEQFAKRNIANSKKQSEEIIKIKAAENSQLEALQNQALAFGFQIAGKNKALQTGLTLISTFFSAQKAFESQFLPIATIDSPVRGSLAAALAIVSGLARVASINQIQGFARGGLITSGFGVPISRSNGDNILATVKTGEVILNQNQQSALGGARTFARIGVPGFAGGGLIGMARQSERNINMQNSLSSLSDMKIYLAYTDFNDGLKNYVRTTEPANVL